MVIPTIILATLILTLIVGGKLMATQQEIVDKLTAVDATLTKISAESAATVAEVARLTDLISQNGEIPEEIATLVNQISDRVNAIDSLVADVTPENPDQPQV